MNYLSLTEAEKKIRAIASQLGSSLDSIYFNKDGSGGYDGYNIFVNEDGYNLSNEERGKIIERKTTKDVKVLLYWIAKSLTFSIASDYEIRWRLINSIFRWILRRKNNIPDSRRLLFKRQLELLKRIDPVFDEWRREELRETLKRNPFTDGLPNTDTI
jgi:hypothetical protein